MRPQRPRPGSTQRTASTLGSRIAYGLAWSSVNSLVLRLGSFVVGIVLARLLAPEQFGVFAVALTVQAVLMTLADLGMSADLIRSEHPERKAPTVATLGLVAGALLAATMATSAQGLADVLGSPGAGPVIAVMSLSLFLAGAGVVPYAALQRSFAQKKLFAVATVDFVVGTVLTIVLILSGWGVMSLAVARVVSQCAALVLQYALAGERIKFGFDRAVAPAVLGFGLPVAAANMLSWALLNVDTVVISRLAGPVALGFYYLAFNVSNWPMSALGQVVRSISIPTFARLASGKTDKSFAVVFAPVWAISLFAGVMIAVLAEPIVGLVYGTKWLPAVPILMWLGFFGALRTLFDLAASYLLARGASRSTLVVQVVWFLALIPAVIAGISWAGTPGVAAAHLATAVLLVAPVYLLALRRSGAELRNVFAAFWPPVVAAVPAGLAAAATVSWIGGGIGGLLLGGLAGTVVYGLALVVWLRHRISAVNALASGPEAFAPASQLAQPVIATEKGTL